MWCDYVKPVWILKKCANNFSCWDEILGKRPDGQVLQDHMSKKISNRMGMTLRSLKTYGYIDNKTKSYWIQRRFLLLFIILPSRPWPSGCMPSDLILPAVYLQNFRILGGTHLFTQAFSDPRSVLQSEPTFAEFFTDPQKSQLLLQWVSWPNTRKLYLLHPASHVFFHPHGGSKGLKLCVDWRRLFVITQATDQGWGWL